MTFDEAVFEEVAFASDDMGGDPGEGTDEVDDEEDEEDGDRKF